MVTAFRQVIGKEGAGALLTGLGPTAVGYAIQGAFKFGGYEFWKKTFIDQLGVEKAFALGTSQGGWMVTRMALLAPERVRSFPPT